MYEYNYTMRGWYWGETACADIDALTFKTHNSVWASDSRGVLKCGKRFRPKDPTTFQVLNHLFAKDSQHVYYILGTAKAVVDPASFEVLNEPETPGIESRETSSGYARDKLNVYFACQMSGAPKILRGADRDTFQVFAPARAKDCRNVWAGDSKMKGADPATIELIDDLYSKDARHVFYSESPLPGADPQTFRVIGRYTGADKSSVYYYRERIEGADPLTYVCKELD